MSELTDKGRHIADQINGEDCYGYDGLLTMADVWLIIDNLHTHFLDTDRDTDIFGRWMRELEETDPALPVC